MTAKEYLQQARRLDELINSNIRELDYWQDLSGRISGSSFEPHYNPNRNIEPNFVKYAGKIAEMREQINEQVDRLVDLRHEINTAIAKLSDPEEQLVLRYRYCEDFSWNNIAEKMNVSLRTVHRLHGSALNNFIVP